MKNNILDIKESSSPLENTFGTWNMELTNAFGSFGIWSEAGAALTGAGVDCPVAMGVAMILRHRILKKTNFIQTALVSS